MDVEIANPVINDPSGISGIISIHRDLVNPIFIIEDTAFEEASLYNHLSGLDTPEAACTMLRIIERLSQLRRDAADSDPNMSEILLDRVRASYIRYDQYCRSVIDDTDIVESMEQLTL